MMCSIWLCSVEVSPSQETAGPISLPGFMIGDELIVVDGSIGLVQGVGTPGASIICEAGGDRYASAGKKDGLPRSITRGIITWSS